MTTCISCSTIRIVRFLAMRRTSSIVPWVSAALMPAVGSSRHSSCGSVASAMPISRLRCSPCERLAASSSALSRRPTESSTALALSMMSVKASWWVSMLHACRRDCAAIRTFSSVVALGRMLVIWYERAMPFCEMRSGGNPVMSSPLKRIRPAEGRSTPVRQLKKVLFPAPFGPMMARISPRWISKLTLSSAVSPPKRTVRPSVHSTAVTSRPAPARAATSSDASAVMPPPTTRGAVSRSSYALYRDTRSRPRGPLVLGGGELAGRREKCLLLRDHLGDARLGVLDLEDELADEGLVVFLAQYLVALREVVALLHLEPFQRFDQLHRVLAAAEARLLHAELQGVDRLEVRLHVAVG